MFRVPSIAQGILLLLASLTLCVFVIEGLVRAFVPVRNVGPSFTTYDPVYGKRLKRSFNADRISPEFEMRFSTNSFGFRGPELSEWPQRSILFVGDSFTMGYGVSDGQEFPALIGRHLADKEGEGQIPIINVGMGDNGNGRPLKFLRDEAAELEPRLIVLQFTWNDFIDNHRERLFTLDESSDELIEFDTVPAGKTQTVQAWIESVPGLSYSYLVGFARQLVSEALWARSVPKRPLTAPELQQRDRLTYRLIEELFSLTKERGWPVIVLTVGIGEERMSVLKQLGDLHDINLIAVPSGQQRPDLYYRIDGHWNEAGHADVADLLASWLEDNRQVWAGLSPGS